MHSPALPVRALLFDLGRVVLDIDFDRAVAAWAAHSRLPLQRVREAFRHDEPYQQHEVGRLPSEEYFAHLRQVLALDCDIDSVREGFNAILVGEIEETLALIDAVPRELPRYVISNTNAVHLAELERAWPRLLRRFDRIFVSHEIGHRKPDARAFSHVVRETGVPAGGILLFDDLPENVEGARACGLQAVLVRSPADVRQALLERGLVSAS